MNKSSKKIIKVIPGNYIIYVVIFFNFIIPQVLIPRSLLILIFTIIPTIYLIIKYKYSITSFIFIIILTLVMLIAPTNSKILNLYYIILFVILARAYQGRIQIPSFINIMLLFGTISIIFQIFYFTFTKDDSFERLRFGLGTDVNFSALIVLLLFFFLKKTNRIYAYIPLLLGVIIFQSRALLLSAIVFVIIEWLACFSFSKTLLKKVTHALPLIILTNVIFLIFGVIYLQQTFFINDDGKKKDIGRLIRINDASNQGRLIANQTWVFELLTGKYFIKGENIESGDQAAILIPHNSLIYLLITSSVLFSVVYLVVFSWVLYPLLNRRNYKYFYSYFTFSLFLHGLFSSIFLFPFMLVLLIDDR